MKNFTQTCCIFLLLLSTTLHAQTPCEDLLGVWEYERDDRNGFCIITPTHYIVVLEHKGRMGFNNTQPDEKEKAAAFSTFTASAGAFSCEGNRGILSHLFNADPSLVGTDLHFDFEIEGNLEKYWVIQPDGNRGPMAKTRKVADWDEISDCSGLTGVWEHLDLKGLFIQAGNYAGWIVVDPDQAAKAADLESEAGKASAYDAFSANFAVSTCKPGGKTDHILLSNDPSREGRLLHADLEWQEGHMRGWILNPDGSRIGEGMRMRRIRPAKDKYITPRQTFQTRHSRMIYQITGSFTGALHIAKKNGISAEEYGRQLGELYKYSWNKEAGAEGYTWGMLHNSVSFSTDPDAIEIVNQSDTAIEYKWKANWEDLFEDGELYGTTLEEYYAFFNGVMQPISNYLGATYEQKRLDGGWLWVSIGEK